MTSQVYVSDRKLIRKIINIKKNSSLRGKKEEEERKFQLGNILVFKSFSSTMEENEKTIAMIEHVINYTNLIC